MPRLPAIRPTSILCQCGAEVEVRRDGPLPRRCPACVRVDQIVRLTERLVEDVPIARAMEIGRVLKVAGERAVYRAKKEGQ